MYLSIYSFFEDYVNLFRKVTGLDAEMGYKFWLHALLSQSTWIYHGILAFRFSKMNYILFQRPHNPLSSGFPLCTVSVLPNSSSRPLEIAHHQLKYPNTQCLNAIFLSKCPFIHLSLINHQLGRASAEPAAILHSLKLQSVPQKNLPTPQLCIHRYSVSSTLLDESDFTGVVWRSNTEYETGSWDFKPVGDPRLCAASHQQTRRTIANLRKRDARERRLQYLTYQHSSPVRCWLCHVSWPKETFADCVLPSVPSEGIPQCFNSSLSLRQASFCWKSRACWRRQRWRRRPRAWTARSLMWCSARPTCSGEHFYLVLKLSLSLLLLNKYRWWDFAALLIARKLSSAIERWYRKHLNIKKPLKRC